MKLFGTDYNVKTVSKLSKDEFMKRYKGKVQWPERAYEEIQKASGKPKPPENKELKKEIKNKGV